MREALCTTKTQFQLNSPAFVFTYSLQHLPKCSWVPDTSLSAKDTMQNRLRDPTGPHVIYTLGKEHSTSINQSLSIYFLSPILGLLGHSVFIASRKRLCLGRWAHDAVCRWCCWVVHLNLYGFANQCHPYAFNKNK
ncbi:hypothetical protein HJG60_011852 [Phyllostomus discolor]|uniref:Uncharacterized protein n=1 Tax=Phyllostomus discolor TaxID=89673 RepID=A0A833ZLH0_9CHIR|nr:hypothetical protein HJG60_011852 [Phyllostomus discolor]